MKNQKGFALVLALVLLVVMSLMGGALIVISSGDHQTNNTSDNFVSIEWDGVDMNGGQVSNGTYMYTLNINIGNQEYNKMGFFSIIR